MIEQETLNKMSFTLLQLLEEIINQRLVDGASIQMENPNGETFEIDVNETLDICLNGLSEKISKEEQ